MRGRTLGVVRSSIGRPGLGWVVRRVLVVALVLGGCGTGTPVATPTTVLSTTAAPETPASTLKATPSASPATTFPAPTPTVAPSASTAPSVTPSSTGGASVSPSVAPSQPVVGGITITAKDYFYKAPTTVASGLVPVTLENAGQESHQAQLVRLRGGNTLRELAAAVQDPSGVAMLAIVDLTGGPNAIPPGQRETTMQTLEPGSYGILCFVRSPDGTPHVAKGMIGGFSVQEPATGNAPPATDADVKLQEFSFSLPATLTAGTHALKVVNGGEQPHEFSLVKLAAGKTFDDAIATVSDPGAGPPPWTTAGGLGRLAPGATGFVTLEGLDAGTYVALCLVTDPATGKPHAALGMIAKVEVP